MQDAIRLRESRIRRLAADDDGLLAELAVERRDLGDDGEAQRVFGIFLGEDPRIEGVDDQHEHDAGRELATVQELAGFMQVAYRDAHFLHFAGQQDLMQLALAARIGLADG